MMLKKVRRIFAWCSLINLVLLILAFLVLTLGHNWAYGINSRMFAITEQQFNVACYAFLGLYKLFVFFFNLIPYFAMRIVGD